MLYISKIFILLVIIGVSAKPPRRIIGGQDAQDGDAPWQVSLQVHGQHICGGSVISSKHILTSARCVVDILEDIENHLTIVAGSNDLSPGRGNSYGVKKIIPHENYQPMNHFLNDIALITIKGEIAFDDYQSPISLPNYNTPGNIRAVVTGWGEATPNGLHFPTLQTITMSTLDNKSCNSDYGGEINENEICAIKKKGTGICQGDIGGPLVSDNTLIGITSHSLGSCAKRLPDVFIRVYNYLDWIQEAKKRSL